MKNTFFFIHESLLWLSAMTALFTGRLCAEEATSNDRHLQLLSTVHVQTDFTFLQSSIPSLKMLMTLTQT